MLFALNGTFAWIGNSVLNPIAFLPMLLLGIEVIFDSASAGERKGWYLAAIALTLSIYSGFPEVALLDGLFCLGWACVRLFSLPGAMRRIAALRVGLAGLVGALISLPILVPFDDFLKVAFIGQHEANEFGQVSISTPTCQARSSPAPRRSTVSPATSRPVSPRWPCSGSSAHDFALCGSSSWDGRSRGCWALSTPCTSGPCGI
jgi:hypothetical protein